jgi:uncharacterized protein (DUF2062 family)
VTHDARHPAHPHRAARATFYQRFLAWFKEFLKMGLTPDAIALCVAFGVVIGIFPFLGVSTALAAVVAIVLRLNMPLIQAVNYLMAPVHLLAIIPWIQVGAWIFGRPEGPLRAQPILDLIQKDYWEALTLIGWDVLRGVGAWCLAAPFLVALLYWALKPLSHKAAERLR